MGKLWTAGLALVALVALTAGPVRAEDKAAERAAGADRKAEFLKKYDTNGNGQIDPEEREKALAARGADGKGRPGGPGFNREELLKKYDANGNGKLDPEEIEKAKASRGDGTGRPGAPGFNREELLKKYDANGNGQLDPEEREKAKAEFLKNRPAGATRPGQPGERKPGERKPGEQKPGERKPGEKPAEKKPADAGANK